MANGKEGDGPLSDMLNYGRHPFPIKIEDVLLQVLALDPDFPDGRRLYTEQLRWYERFDEWQDRIGVEEGVAALTAVLEELRGESKA